MRSAAIALAVLLAAVWAVLIPTPAPARQEPVFYLILDRLPERPDLEPGTVNHSLARGHVRMWERFGYVVIVAKPEGATVKADGAVEGNGQSYP